MIRYRQSPLSFFQALSLLFISSAVLLLVFQLVRFSRIRLTFSPGQVIAGVPVGGLTQQQAADRLLQAYGVPIELRYNDQVIQLRPSTVGFDLELEAMIAAADLQRINQPFWSAFWDYLWNQMTVPPEVPLRARISEDRLRTYLLEEIAPRYDQPPIPPQPVPGSTSFEPGTPGVILNIDRAVALVEDALRSPANRIINLTFDRANPTRPSFANLQILLGQTIDLSGFDGLTEIYLLDLESGQEISFARENGQNVVPGVAFTAASTMKIPIMVATYKRMPEPMSAQVMDLLRLMIERSGNEIGDTLMKSVMDQNLAPLQMTDDLRQIGLQNTFMAGFFTFGSPLLQRFETPANTRADYSTDPDPYNQTTPIEMGALLTDIYLCAQYNGGTLRAAFPTEITQTECQQMIDLLSGNLIGVLIQAGLPEGARFAHKHGWSVDPLDGMIHQIADAGIVFTPGGNYILCVYQYHPVQLVFDPVNALVADLSRTVYNYYNLQ